MFNCMAGFETYGFGLLGVALHQVETDGHKSVILTMILFGVGG